MLVYRLYVCVILTCNLANFSEFDTCVCCSTCEGTNLVVFLSLFSKMFSFLTGSLIFFYFFFRELLLDIFYYVYPYPVETFRGSNLFGFS
jgi:hypothetical protein